MAFGRFNVRLFKREMVSMTEGQAHSAATSYAVHNQDEKGYRGSTTTLISTCQKGFRKVDNEDIFSVVKALCKEGRLKEALQVLDVMDQQGCKAFSDTYVCLLQRCISMKAFVEGKWVHSHFEKSRFKPNILLNNTLVNMYVKCGSLIDACKVFEKMHERNVFTWTMMISGFAKHGFAEKALELFQQMQVEGVKPDKVTLSSILKACARLKASEEGKQIHAHIIKSGFESDIYIGNSLVHMYAKCGSIQHAHDVFQRMPKRNVISWAVMIAGYAQNGHSDEALNLFWQMEQECVKPNKVTFLSILNACARLGNLAKGKQIHSCIINSGVQLDAFLESTLIDMYAKCGSIDDARVVFDKMAKRDVVSWNVMVAGYAQHGDPEEALKLFHQMQQEGIKPDVFTFVSILNACATLAALEQGKQIHAQLIKSGSESNIYICNSLIHMYAKCGSMKYACLVFENMPKRDQVSWTTMMAGYTHYGYDEEAFKLFWEMQQEGLEPDQFAVVNGLNACANLASLEQGKQLHAYIIKMRFEYDVYVGNALIDMYAKCGNIVLAHQVFKEMPKRDVISWTIMIVGYAQHGHGKEALQLVEQMLQEGVKLDPVIFAGILFACSHAGLVDDGCQYFESMSQDHGIAPTADHYVCMVDLLGRAALLEEVVDFIKKIPFQATAMVWTALLGACKNHGNMKLAKHTTECILKVDPQNLRAFVLLSNIYATAGRWEDKAKVMNIMKNNVVKSRVTVASS